MGMSKYASKEDFENRSLADRLSDEAGAWRNVDDIDIAKLLDEARGELERLRKDAGRYQWLRDTNDWYVEPRIDEADGTMWELVFYTPMRIEDADHDDSRDAAIDAAMGEKP